MKTEIQTVEGEFKLGADWPKLVYPALSDGLIIDWVADDLKVGPLTAPWQSRVSNTHPLSPLAESDTGIIPNEVKLDSNGHNYVEMLAGQRLRTWTIDWAIDQDITIMAVVRPRRPPEGSGLGTNSRIISGANGGFRSILHTPGTYSIGVTGKTTRISSASVFGRIEAVMGRYGKNIYDGKQYGQNLVVPTEPYADQKSVQQYVLVGGNDTTQANAKLYGDLFRISIWDRLLTDQEMDAALADQAKTYGF